MKTRSYHLLVTAAGQLMQQHAFDHLPDEKLVRMNSCLHRLGRLNEHQDKHSAELELLELCNEVNLYVETTTPQALHQFYTAMNYFGRIVTSLPEVEEQA